MFFDYILLWCFFIAVFHKPDFSFFNEWAENFILGYARVKIRNKK